MESLLVIKIGGNVIDQTQFLQSFLKDFAAIKGHKILIHGGGKIATSIGNKLGVAAQYLNGRRITDDDTIDIVTMVYGGLVNKKIVAQLQALGCNAIGLCGADANIISATKRPLQLIDGQSVDFGWVGDIDPGQLRIDRLRLMLEAGLEPVFAPLTHDGQGHILNTNADTIAATLAVGLSTLFQVRLVYCFDKKGVLEDVQDEQSVIRQINKARYHQLRQENRLFEGIIPKIDNAFAAIDAGVHEVLIGHAGDLVQNATDATVGTLISK